MLNFIKCKLGFHDWRVTGIRYDGCRVLVCRRTHWGEYCLKTKFVRVKA